MTAAEGKSDNAAPGTDAVPTLATRIHSMDQFRGFVVIAMLIVDFDVLSAFQMFRHEGGQAFADMIMPAFIFAAGYSFRLTSLRKFPQLGLWGIAADCLRRSAILILILLVMQGFDFGRWKQWDDFAKPPQNYVPPPAAASAPGPVPENEQAEVEHKSSILPTYFWMNWGYWFLGIFRRRLCDVLGIIALTQLFVLPVILTSVRIRILAMLICGVGHMLLTHWFNWDFFYARPNIVDGLLHLKPRASYDGGFFGTVSWSVVMLGGTLAYDIVAQPVSRMQTARRLFAYGVAMMCLGYVLSMPGRIYDLPSASDDEINEETERLQTHPVFPPIEWMKGRAFRDWFPPIPVLQSDDDWNVAGNYWLVSKSLTTLPFVVFASGFAFALYAVFVVMTDRFGVQIGVFRTFGTNALAAYVTHDFVQEAMTNSIPAGAPQWYRYAAFAGFFLVVYTFVRTLEAKKIYVRL